MPSAADVAWFKKEFGPQIRTALVGAPFTVDMLTAIACQETGYIWSTLRRKGLSTSAILRLCVGDSIDGKPDGTGRRAFPRTRSDIDNDQVAGGRQMFGIGRQALVDMSAYIPGYSGAAGNQNKFCRGYGIFQYDLQHFRTDPQYFLERRYEDFGESLGKCVEELGHALQHVGLGQRTSLTEAEMAAVAIAYNTGGYDPRKGLLQGYKSDGKYYGQLFVDYLRLARSVDGAAADFVPPQPKGVALVSLPTIPTASGDAYVVDTRVSNLRVRREPAIDRKRPRSNVITELPDGYPVRAVGTAPVNGFLEIETTLRGAFIHGFASTTYLKRVSRFSEDQRDALIPSTDPIEAAVLPRRAGQITRRSDAASAHSLNEPGQPKRSGTTPQALRDELAAIIDWLAVDNPGHKRYQGDGQKTFCNIYAHDYCHLAGVYLARVWWNGVALQRMARGEVVQALYGQTVDEQRANDLFRWLRDFGTRFGWRQTGSVGKLQAEVNEGAVGLIVARRRIEGKSGHIVMVVPETEAFRARRDGNAEVASPVQSQAGVTNFRYGYGRPQWWLGEQFAEHAFWLHS